MSRSGYSEDLDNQELNLWRGAVASAIRGKRGQAFLREMLWALDTLPQKRLITGDLIKDGEVCALGAVAVKRGMDVSMVDVEDAALVGYKFGIAHALAAEIEYINDEVNGHHVVFGEIEPNGRVPRTWRDDTPEERFDRVRAWVIENIK